MESLLSFTHEETTSIMPSITKAPAILLVDDDPLALERMRQIIEGAGFEVFTADSGAAALESLSTRFTPIVILDRDMPDLDGIETCKRIRLQKFPSYVYLILWTVQDNDSDVTMGLESGADEYLSKRISSAQIVARLKGAQRILSLEQALKHMLAERRQMAETDALTGTYNRRYFMKNGEKCLHRAKKSKVEFSVLALDIDHFKSINDKHGHIVGDKVLVECVRRIRAALSPRYEWCARTGGEEFVVVLERSDLKRARRVAERIRHAIEKAPVESRELRISVTMSIGVSGLGSVSHKDDVDIEAILKQADECLYRSKTSGRNKVTMASPIIQAPSVA